MWHCSYINKRGYLGIVGMYLGNHAWRHGGLPATEHWQERSTQVVCELGMYLDVHSSLSF
jgi:hypothetical protein